MGLVRFIADLFIRSRKDSSPSSEDVRHVLGRRGEKLASLHLARNGYKVLYRNFKAPHGGEVDIVCRDKVAGELVFVEVKTRSSLDFGSPGEAVNAEKQQLIARGALAWLRMLGNPPLNFRFDIVEIVFSGDQPSFNIIRDAFVLPEPNIY